MKPWLKNWLSRNNTLLRYIYATALSRTGKGCGVLLLSVHTLCAQNLVQNGSFETLSSCPNGISQLYKATPWIDPGGSTDVFNTCTPAGTSVSIPTAFVGFQYPRTGNSFAGIYCYYPDFVTREYMQAPLVDTLQAGECYFVTFYTNLHNDCWWGLRNSVAGVFTDSSFTNPGVGLVNLHPQIRSYRDNTSLDTLHWTPVRGIYKAHGGERYFTIGCFRADSLIDTVQTNRASWFNAAYYYIDDVSVLPVSSIGGGIPAFAGNDTTILAGDSVFIGQNMTGLDCNFYENSTLIASHVPGLYVHPGVTTSYIMEQHLCGSTTYDTVTVHLTHTGIAEQHDAGETKLSPNPSNGFFHIEMQRASRSPVRLSVYSTEGREVYNSELRNGQSSADLDLQLDNGIYILRITDTGTGATTVKKLVIRR